VAVGKELLSDSLPGGVAEPPGAIRVQKQVGDRAAESSAFSCRRGP
jgi:hypothetical protein